MIVVGFKLYITKWMVMEIEYDDDDDVDDCRLEEYLGVLKYFI